MAGYADRTNKNRAERKAAQLGIQWPICKGVKGMLTDLAVKEARQVNPDGTTNMRVAATWKPYAWPAEHDATFTELVHNKSRNLETVYFLTVGSKSKKIVQGMHDDLLTDLEDAGIDMGAIPAPGPGQNYADVDPGYTILRKVLSMVMTADTKVKVELDIAMGQKSIPDPKDPQKKVYVDDPEGRRKIWMKTPFNKVVEMQPVQAPVAQPVVEQPAVQAPVEQPAPAAVVQPVAPAAPVAAAPVSTTPPPPPSMAGLGV